MISVLILTKNEEANLSRCIESVAWSDDIVVLDNGSSDRTVDIARQHGVRVVCYSAGAERAQRTYSLREIMFKYPWVYNPDADEVTPPDLRDEMLRVLADPDRQEVAYRVRFRNMFMGKWIRHSSLYPTWVMRLFRPDKISFERTTNLVYKADGPIGMLQSHFEHYSFNHGFNAWFEKHNEYSWHEAVETVTHLERGKIDWAGLFEFNSPVRRRRALKELSFRLPFRPTLRFIYMYFLRRGFLDGMPGLTYCRLLSIYEHLIVLKMKEIRRREKGLPL